MEGQMIVAMVLGTPILLLPVAFVWYLNSSAIRAAVKETRKKTTTEKKATAGA